MKALISHIFSTTNNFLASRIWGISLPKNRLPVGWVALDRQFLGPLRMCWDRWVILLSLVPIGRQIFFGACCLPIIQSSDGSLRSIGTVGVGMYCDRGCWYQRYWSPLPYRMLSREHHFPFCWHLYWEMRFSYSSVTVSFLQAESTCLLPKGSCIFDTQNSLHKQGSMWVWSKLAPEHSAG